MKRIILSVFLIASAYALTAQEVTIYRLGTTTSNPGYTVPMDIRTSFQVTYPTVTTVTWEPMKDYWVASYTENNRVQHVYYNTQPWYLYNSPGASFHVSLPVLQTFVPDAVITTAINRFGNALYDITRMKGAANDEIYTVRLLENGVARNVWMDANGTEVVDVYTVHTTDDTMLKADLDDSEKTKTEQKVKIKTEDDKTKIKKDDDHQ